MDNLSSDITFGVGRVRVQVYKNEVISLRNSTYVINRDGFLSLRYGGSVVVVMVVVLERMLLTFIMIEI